MRYISNPCFEIPMLGNGGICVLGLGHDGHNWFNDLYLDKYNC